MFVDAESATAVYNGHEIEVNGRFGKVEFA